MTAFPKIIFWILFSLQFYPGRIFTLGIRTHEIPAKMNSVVNIPDGEFLHYGNYVNGEKVSDMYFTAIIVSNGSGRVYFKIYSETIPLNVNSKRPGDFTNWTGYTVIDPYFGTVVETEKHFDTNFLKSLANVGGDILYYHYQLDRVKGCVDYEAKSARDGRIFVKHSRVKVNPRFPSWDRASLTVFSMRFIDFGSEGVVYLVAPEVMKTPLSCTYRYLSGETVLTKAGSFRTDKLNLLPADPFISRLMYTMSKDIFFYVEKSGKKLLIKIHTPSIETILEEISNINVKYGNK